MARSIRYSFDLNEFKDWIGFPFVYCRIGNNILEGKLQKLKKPLLIVYKKKKHEIQRTTTESTGTPSKIPQDQSVSHTSHLDLDNTVQWDAQGIVRQKYIFQTRPSPVVASAAQT